MTHINNPDQPPQGNLADITWTPASGITITRMLLYCGCIAEPCEPSDLAAWQVTDPCAIHLTSTYPGPPHPGPSDPVLEQEC